MMKVVARNNKEIEEYRRKLFKAKEAHRKEQARLPFEKKIEIATVLNQFARQWGQRKLEGRQAAENRKKTPTTKHQ